MSFDPSQFGATPVAPTPPGFNPAQYNATPVTAANAPAPSLAQSVWSGLAGAGSAVVNTAKGGISNVTSGLKDLETAPKVDPQAVAQANAGGGPLAGGLEAGAQIAKAGVGSTADLGKVVGGIVQTILSPLFAATNAIGTPIGKAIVNAIPASWGEALNNFLAAHPEVGENTTQDLNIANLAVPDVAEKVGPTISDTGSALKDAVTPTPPDPIAVKAVADAKTATQLQGVAQDWEKPSTINQPSYKNARAALEKAPGTPQFLAEQGLNPFAHVEDGKYSTEEAAQNLRDTAGKLSNETLRPSLQAADQRTPLTPVTDITRAAMEQAQKTPHITADDAEAIATNIAQKGDALARKYPDGMSLENMHDEKITYAKNGGYSQFKSNADTNAAISNKTMGSTLADMVEETAPPELPVHDFNAYLQKYYQAADYLDALNGKKAPVSTAQAVARGVSKFGGAVIARHLAPGIGDLVSTFAGYKIGGALEHAAENFTNPMRDTFLRNLKITNPEAFTKVQAYANSAPK